MEHPENPYIDKLVGLPKEQAHLEPEWHTYIIDTIEQIGGKEIKEFEVIKTEKEIELIHFTDTAVDAMLHEYGRTKRITVPLENIHVLKEDGTQEYTKNTFYEAAYSESSKSIIVDRTPSNIAFTLHVFHELVHLKSYTAMQVIPGRDGAYAQIETYRSGISVVSRDGQTVYLKDMEEAIIGYLTAKFYTSVIQHDARFKDEVDNIKNGSMDVDISRQEELEALNEIVEQIFEKNKVRFSSKDEVLNLFIKAQVNGNLLPVGRLVEQTFGQGALKKLGVSTK